MTTCDKCYKGKSQGPMRTQTRQPDLIQGTVRTGDAEEVTGNVEIEGYGGITQAEGGEDPPSCLCQG